VRRHKKRQPLFAPIDAKISTLIDGWVADMAFRPMIKARQTTQKTTMSVMIKHLPIQSFGLFHRIENFLLFLAITPLDRSI